MALKVCDHLFIGDVDDCHYHEQEGWAVIHACKDPCHKKGVGYTGNLERYHENYLIKEESNHLYLNMVDMDILLPEFMDPMMKAAIDFIKKNIKDKNIVIHCNQGRSRSPGIALVYLAKVVGVINNNSYSEAKFDFFKLYPDYNPDMGIENYIKFNWDRLNWV